MIKVEMEALMRVQAERADCPFYEVDPGDRIIAALEQADVSARKRLAPAARPTGQQLELLMQAILAHDGKDRLIAGKFTMAPPRTLAFVLANQRRVALVQVRDQPDLIEHCVMLAQELCAFAMENGGNVRRAGVTVTTQFLREYCGKPGARTKPAPALGAQNTIGVLLAALADDEIRNTLTNARNLAACGLCPALVCLIGRGAKAGTSAACWPMLLPIAPHLDNELLAAVEAGDEA